MQNIVYILTILLFLALLTLRIFEIGGLDKTATQDLELESFASSFTVSRNYLSDTITYLLPEPQAQLLSGILLGVKTNLPTELKKDLRETSTIHIVVVSGQNLSMISGFILFLAPLLGRRKTIILGFIAISFYSLLTGLQIPVIRAAIMASFSYLAQLLGKENDGLRILIITAALMLLFNPNWIFSISFQLSFLATTGVVFVAPALLSRAKFIPEILREDLVVSFAAQLMTIPIIALNFHTLSVSGILVNALVLWTIPLIMLSGAISLISGLVFLELGQILGLIPNIMLTYFVYIVEVFGSLQNSSIYIGKISVFFWLGYYLLILALVVALRKNIKITPEIEKLLRKAG